MRPHPNEADVALTKSLELPPTPSASKPSLAVGLPVITAAIEVWFRRAARPMPWRTTPRDPWASLVSEVMAQQTQISRVVERYPAFLARFPTPAALADASEQEVLAMWAGMGYYRRARLLHAASRAIVANHAGHVPASITELLRLPGIGRYTAGAIASIALNQPEPIVDGNVARVLLRLHAREGRAGDRASDVWCWEQAASLVRAASDPAALNEGLMELGATVCVPRSPDCASCPLANECLTRQAGLQDRIPAPKPRTNTPAIHAMALIALDAKGRLLVEQRPATPTGGGMWAGMWQVPTLETPVPPTAAARRAWAHGSVGHAILSFDHQTTHRLFRFDVRQCRCDAERAGALGAGESRRWVTPKQAAALPMSNPQRRILDLTR